MTPEARRHVESILLVAEEPVSTGILAQVLEIEATVVQHGLEALAAEYDESGRGFCLREVAGGWRFYSHPDSSAYVERFVHAAENPRLSRAALECLAIVAYRQPISRNQVAEIRGVNSDAVIRTLALRGLIDVIGHDDGPGQASLYGTTSAFLEQLGLRSLDEMPPLADFVPGADTAARYDAALATSSNEAKPAVDGGADVSSRIRSKLAAARSDLDSH